MFQYFTLWAKNRDKILLYVNTYHRIKKYMFPRNYGYEVLYE